jgi:hypothetical protein
VTIHISSEDDNVNALHYGDSFTVAIRHAKPSTQVWGIEYSPDGSSNGPPDSNGAITAGARSLGFTDSTGYFLYLGKNLQTEGFHVLQFYVGGTVPTPDADGIIADDFYIGSVSFWAYDINGVHPPPTFQ